MTLMLQLDYSEKINDPIGEIRKCQKVIDFYLTSILLILRSMSSINLMRNVMVKVENVPYKQIIEANILNWEYLDFPWHC